MTWAVIVSTLLAPSRPANGNGRMSDGHSIVAHGARSLLVTGLVAVMVLAAIAVAPPADLPWHYIPGSYAACVVIAAVRARFAASGGIAPIGTQGDARFALAAIATAGIAAVPASWPAILAAHPFLVLNLAAALCGAADGAWLALARRHLQVADARALVMFMAAIRSGDACSWRIVTGGRP